MTNYWITPGSINSPPTVKEKPDQSSSILIASKGSFFNDAVDICKLKILQMSTPELSPESIKKLGRGGREFSPKMTSIQDVDEWSLYTLRNIFSPLYFYCLSNKAKHFTIIDCTFLVQRRLIHNLRILLRYHTAWILACAATVRCIAQNIYQRVQVSKLELR